MSGRHESDGAALISVTPAYVLTKLEEHTKECTGRWTVLILTVLGGFGSLTLALLGLIGTLIWRGHP